MLRLPPLQLLMLALLVVAVVVANLDQPYPDVAPLQHIPTIVLVLFAPALLSRWPMTNRSVALLFIFMLLHTLAGRYTYSNVPYERWALTWSGFDIDRVLGSSRNDFDRLVHLAFGLFWTTPVAEVYRRYGKLDRSEALSTAFMFIGAASALYEIFEWLLTLSVAPQLAADYNGQQGDPWDSQKDMACALVGSTMVMLTVISCRKDDRRKTTTR